MGVFSTDGLARKIMILHSCVIIVLNISNLGNRWIDGELGSRQFPETSSHWCWEGKPWCRYCAFTPSSKRQWQSGQRRTAASGTSSSCAKSVVETGMSGQNRFPWLQANKLYASLAGEIWTIWTMDSIHRLTVIVYKTYFVHIFLLYVHIYIYIYK